MKVWKKKKLYVESFVQQGKHDVNTLVSKTEDQSVQAAIQDYKYFQFSPENSKKTNITLSNSKKPYGTLGNQKETKETLWNLKKP